MKKQSERESKIFINIHNRINDRWGRQFQADVFATNLIVFFDPETLCIKLKGTKSEEALWPHS